MIAITATVRPLESPHALKVLERCLRRDYRNIRVFDDSLVVHLPNVGRVLITEELTMMRLDFVANDLPGANAAMLALEQQICTQVFQQNVTIEWSKPDRIPAVLR